MSAVLFVGVEGGSSVTSCALIDGDGNILSNVKGPSTNPFMVGFDQCHKLISDFVHQLLEKAGLPRNTKIKGIGLSLSGIETKETRDTLNDVMLEHCSSICKNYVICSDTIGPIAAMGDSGGSVLISGTGSNCLLMNEDESEVQCGGYGHLLGDEGSAYGISIKAIKICLNSMDGFKQPPNGYSIDGIWKAIKEHFRVETGYEIIPEFYTRFNKCKIAELCREISKIAENGDNLAKLLFEKAGRDLARHVQAVYKKVHENLKTKEGGLRVVCVGSVWNSWELLKGGFIDQINNGSYCVINELSLVKLTVSPALGAAYLAAKHVDHHFPLRSSKNYNVFFHYVRECSRAGA